MIDKIEALNSRIKMNFIKHNRPLPISYIQGITADLFPSHDLLSVALKSLVDRGSLRVINGSLIPIDNEGVVRVLEGSERHTVKKEGIIRVLALIGQGTPAEVGSAYLKFIDGKVNVESVPRILRFMYADGEVTRQGDVYSTASRPTLTLGAFA